MPSSKVLFYLINLNGASAGALIVAYLLVSSPAHREFVPHEEADSGTGVPQAETQPSASDPEPKPGLAAGSEPAAQHLVAVLEPADGAPFPDRKPVVAAEPDSAQAPSPSRAAVHLPASAFAPVTVADVFKVPQAVVTLKPSDDLRPGWTEQMQIAEPSPEQQLFGQREPISFADLTQIAGVDSSAVAPATAAFAPVTVADVFKVPQAVVTLKPSDDLRPGWTEQMQIAEPSPEQQLFGQREPVSFADLTQIAGVDSSAVAPATAAFAPVTVADVFKVPQVVVTLKPSDDLRPGWLEQITDPSPEGQLFDQRELVAFGDLTQIASIDSRAIAPPASGQALVAPNSTAIALAEPPPLPDSPARTYAADAELPDHHPALAAESLGNEPARRPAPRRAQRAPRDTTQIAAVENRLLSPTPAPPVRENAAEPAAEFLAYLPASSLQTRSASAEEIDPPGFPPRLVTHFEARVPAPATSMTRIGQMRASLDPTGSEDPRDHHSRTALVCLPCDWPDTAAEKPPIQLARPAVPVLSGDADWNYSAQTLLSALLPHIGGSVAARHPQLDLLFATGSIPSPTATSYENLDVGQAIPRTAVPQWFNHTIRSGDTLTSVWRTAGMPLPALFNLLEKEDSAVILNRIRPGQQIEWRVDSNGDLERLRLWHDRSRGVEWIRSASGDGFLHKEIKGQKEFSHLILAGDVNGTLSASLAALEQIPRSSANALVALLDRHFPVRSKAADGDRFTLLIEQETFSGGDSPYEIRLLAFHYQGLEIDVRGVRFSDNRFYTPDGRALAPPFDRHPFVGEFRVSSHFNPRRRHPVTGRVSPHLGTDFPMPVGTPVKAPADGTVIRVDNHARAGRYVEIDHGEGFLTRYLHLQQALVKQGQRVQRGERIALSGNSGRTTAPHLHYELHVDGRPVDPMHADLPSSQRLADADLERFERIAGPLLAQMRDATTPRQIAMRPFSELGF